VLCAGTPDGEHDHSVSVVSGINALVSATDTRHEEYLSGQHGHQSVYSRRVNLPVERGTQFVAFCLSTETAQHLANHDCSHHRPYYPATV